ncbi:hypothetical protein [Isoalcanivorax beigongshangi]|uniref:Phosphate/sulfate permease n=1 Tax=Isoalcanivorax beigongshangi TaxID=3238810 RepID=A0ABV4AJK0_9GAMM
MQELLMVVGFMLAAYSIVANDAIQTLGTFISSNARRPWWVLWLFASLVLVVVLLYGWWQSPTGDAAYHRLDSIPLPAGGLSILYLVPPLVILVLTRFSIPVSTTFLVLTLFAPSSLGGMLVKSLMGYAVAFMLAIVLYRFVIRRTTEYFDRTQGQPVPGYWVVLQWLATAFLWSQWLIQDLANIFVYLPRAVTPQWMSFAVITFVLLLGVIFYRNGGEIQKIVTSKTGTRDIRAATLIDFLYALVLLVFKEWSHLPMSTTWVFLGLLAGREFAIAMHMFKPSVQDTARLVRSDAARAALGLAVSVMLALALPWLYGLL